MPYINVELENGKQFMVNHCEIIWPAHALEGMSAEDIGAVVMVLQPLMTQLRNYISGDPGKESFASVEDFERAVAGQERPRKHWP